MLLGGDRLSKSADPLFKCVLAMGVWKLVFFCVYTLQIALIGEVMWVPERCQKYFLLIIYIL